MSNRWATSERKMPPNWRNIRQAVEARAGGQCERITEGQRCPAKGTECDHAIHRDDHRIESLQWLCREHHTEKTQKEAKAAKDRILAKMRYPEHKHPGLR